MELDDAIRAALGEMINAWRPAGAPVKWVETKNLHLTLKFLGNVADENVETAIEIMKQCTDSAGPFQLAVRGVGAFPTLRQPRVLFVETTDTPPTLCELARQLNCRMTRAGVRREDRPFRRHVTIGRVRKPGPMHALADKLETVADRDFGALTVKRIVLMQSELTRAGPVYARIAEADLGIVRSE